MGGTLALCSSCHLVQNVTNAKWKREIKSIYGGYTIYHQSGGAEQSVFVDGRPVARSLVIGNFLATKFKLPRAGRALDIGCGNGAFLRACSELLPKWTLCGSEFDDKYKSMVEKIPHVEGMYAGGLEDIPGEFDLISLIHVFEHIPSPLNLLEAIWQKLKPGGHLVIEVPDCLENAYMLLVADHCSHFSSGALSKLVSSAGFEVLYSDTKCVRKEITLVARKTLKKRALPKQIKLDARESNKVFAGATWLKSVIRAATVAAKEPNLGIFGSSIAGTWLQSQINNAAKFFVDEDPNRAGRSHMGIPILTPSQIPAYATIVVPLPDVVAKPIIRRLRATKIPMEIRVP